MFVYRAFCAQAEVGWHHTHVLDHLARTSSRSPGLCYTQRRGCGLHGDSVERTWQARRRVNGVLSCAITTEQQKSKVLTPGYRVKVAAAQSSRRYVLPEEVDMVMMF